MKLQGLAIIFVIIILPITIIIGEYARVQRETFKLEQLYDSRLITATDDALDAFQINTFNDATSDIADSKIDSIEASANAFFNSMESNFGLQGYSKEELLNYVPALVYTMYDGYYIYSPYTNVANIIDGTVELNGNETDYGFKPYVYYSCRYVKEDIDVIINYSLDNYITVQGIIGEETVYKSGYLLTMASDSGASKGVREDNDGNIYYNGILIEEETPLKDLLVDDKDGNLREYKYIKLNGTKYYLNDKDDDGDGQNDEYIFYIMGKERVKQVIAKSDDTLYQKYRNQIEHNTSAISYYKSALEFYEWMSEKGLLDLELQHAETAMQSTGNPTDKIFKNENIEYPSSNFNLHRREVIRYSIESNLSVAIANFNSYTKSKLGNNFQMPKLKDNEWELLQNEISIISFLQGLNIGGKIYNGYTVVTNTKTEEVVKEDSIYITTEDGYYHKVNDKHFTNSDVIDTAKLGVLKLDFEIRKDGETGIAYTQKKELGCYTSIVGQENVNNKYSSIYEYLDKDEDFNKLDDEDKRKIKNIYYTALGRERWGSHKIENPSNISTIIASMELEETQNANIITAATVSGDDYGGYVTNYTPENGAGVGWRIFHSDGNNIYLIADNYIEKTYVPAGKSGTTVKESSEYTRGFSLAPYKDYGNGSEDISDTLKEKLLSKYDNYLKTAGSKTTSVQAKATAYLLDAAIWAGFKDSTSADYAIGAPTIELFADSYNTIHDEDIDTQVTSIRGYKIKWSTETYWSANILDLVEDRNGLYVVSSHNHAREMWIASPSNYNLDYEMTVTNSNGTGVRDCDNAGPGFRPIVCLKSNVRIEKKDDGTYWIK